jgi:hypothetical protein
MRLGGNLVTGFYLLFLANLYVGMMLLRCNLALLKWDLIAAALMQYLAQEQMAP